MVVGVDPIIPVLRVKDAQAGARFYHEVLEAKIDWEYRIEPGFPLFISISSGSWRLFLSEHRGTGADNADLYVFVPDVDALHARVSALGIAIEQPPRDQPWNVREMQVRDPDGHRLTFASVLTPAVAPALDARGALGRT